jgi:anti-sigma B factor antagonist
MAMRSRLNGETVVIDLPVNPASEHELLNFVHGLLAKGHRRFVVNLEDLKWLDSAGLGGVAGAYTAVTRLHGGLVLAAPQPPIRTLLDQTKLSTVIPVLDSEPAAVASFDGPRRQSD